MEFTLRVSYIRLEISGGGGIYLIDCGSRGVHSNGASFSISNIFTIELFYKEL